MGQGQTKQLPSKEEFTRDLAEKLARKCFEPLELYSFKDNFKSLADNEQDVRYLKEDTVARYLELPDIIGVSPVIFQMLSYIGAFPFLDDAPAILGFEQMVSVVAIMTERYTKVLAKGAATRAKLLFKSLAVYDGKMVGTGKDGVTSEPKGESSGPRSHASGFAVDDVGKEQDDDDDDEDEDGELVLSALTSVELNNAFKLGGHRTRHGAMIPADNFRKVIMLLLLLAPLGPRESLSAHADRVSGEELENLGSTADSVLSAFLDVEKSPGVSFKHYNRVLPVDFPYLFKGFDALFEQWLFSRNLDLSKRRDGAVKAAMVVARPLLQDKGRILNANVFSQLSFFMPGEELFGRVRLLYSGAESGFSMGSFESKVFNWRAPTLLLVSGSRLAASNKHGPETAFTDTLGPKRFRDGSAAGRLTYGALIRQPWRHTGKEPFGGEDMVLFQVSPTHDVFPASAMNKNYVSFNKPPSPFPGITIGCPQPKGTASRHSSIQALGPVSLVVDSSFECAAFTHDYNSRGGAFANSVWRKFDFQDRIQISDIEVWGCGGDDEAKHQRERWEWEAREAEARRRINLGTGDAEADRALLEIAGLIGANRTGGSMA